MSVRSTAESWGTVTRALHWLSAVLIIGLLAHGWWMTHLAPRDGRLWQYGMHGLVALYFGLLLALRIVWRFGEPTPHQPASSTKWEIAAAHAGHLALYLLMLAMVATGYMLWSSFPARFDPVRGMPFDYSLFGAFKLPAVHTAADRGNAKYWENLHELFSHLLQALVVVHIAAAIWHQRVKGDNIMARMTHGG